MRAKYLDKELPVKERVEDLLSRLSLREKIGQLNQMWGLAPMKKMVGLDIENLIRQGMVGSLLYVESLEERNHYQRIAVEESPHGIPLIFATDIRHGYRTGFPVSIGIASSWDPQVVQMAQSVAAKEARADGVHWTFYPNCDIARDARWGRICETMGEDPYLASRLVAAQVKGFQGNGVNEERGIFACVKHFAGYGAAVGGRDYDSVYLPENELRNVYLPPFKAGLDAGAETVMTAYMDLNDVPATASKYLMMDILRKEWGFYGIVITDASTIKNMVIQGYAKDGEEACRIAVENQINIDLGCCHYLKYLEGLVNSGRITEEQIDDLVRPFLAAKFKLGLFEKPYAEEGALDKLLLDGKHRKAAREAACRSIVLLKNENKLLPLSKNIKKVALIGPLANTQDDLEGILGVSNVPQAVTILQGIKNKLPDAEVIYEPGPWIKRDMPSMLSMLMPDFSGRKVKRNQTKEEADLALKKAVDAAKWADVVICAMGEGSDMSGEAASRSDLNLPGRQEELLKAVADLNKPTVLVVIGGRPLSITWAAENIPAILYAWQPGWEGGNAVADILFGNVNPSAKLPLTIPRSVGQCPIYYAENRTHIPKDEQPQPYSRYWNEPNTPLFPFGFGLSYSEFAYSNIRTERREIKKGESISISVDVTNTSQVDGTEVVQLYIHQRYGSASRPKRELRGFEAIKIKAGETKTITFTLSAQDLTYWSASKGCYVQDETEFDVWVGGYSMATLHTEFKVVG